jgi:phosphosulfolactate phosphohydrolase-like enzyme
MSNNAPDYEDNLAFPPQEIKSQDELLEAGRQTEVLLTTIDECSKLLNQVERLKDIIYCVLTDIIEPMEYKTPEILKLALEIKLELEK